MEYSGAGAGGGGPYFVQDRGAVVPASLLGGRPGRPPPPSPPQLGGYQGIAPGVVGVSVRGFENRGGSIGRRFDTPNLVGSPAAPHGLAGVEFVPEHHAAAALASSRRKRRLDLTVASSNVGIADGRRLDLQADMTGPRDGPRRDEACAYVTMSTQQSASRPPPIMRGEGGYNQSPSFPRRPPPVSVTVGAGTADACGSLLSLSSPGRMAHRRDVAYVALQRQQQHQPQQPPRHFQSTAGVHVASTNHFAPAAESRFGPPAPAGASSATKRSPPPQQHQQQPLQRQFRNAANFVSTSCGFRPPAVASASAPVVARRVQQQPRPQQPPPEPPSPLLYVGASIERTPLTPRLGLNIALFDSTYLVLGDVDDAVADSVTAWSWVTAHPPPSSLLRDDAAMATHRPHDAPDFRRLFASLPPSTGGNAPILHRGLAVRPGLGRLQSGDAIIALNGRAVSSFAGGLDGVTAYLKAAPTLSVVAVRHIDALSAAAVVRAEFLARQRREGATGSVPGGGGGGHLVQHSADRTYRALRDAMRRLGNGAPNVAAETSRGAGTAARSTLFAGPTAAPKMAPAASKAPLIIGARQTKVPGPAFQARAGTAPALNAHLPWNHEAGKLPARPLVTTPRRNGVASTSNGASPRSATTTTVAAGRLPSAAALWLAARGLASGTNARPPMPNLEEDYDPDKYPWLFVPRVPLNTQIEINFSGWLARRKAGWRERWTIEAVAGPSGTSHRRSSVDSLSDDESVEDRVEYEFWKARGFPTFRHWLDASKAQWRVGYSWNKHKRRKLERDCEREVHFPSAGAHDDDDDAVDPTEVSERMQEWLRVRKKQWQMLRRKRQRHLAEEEAAAAALAEEGEDSLHDDAQPSTSSVAENEAAASVDSATESSDNEGPATAVLAPPALDKHRSTSAEVDLIDAILEDQEREEKKFDDRPPFDIAFLFDASLGAPDDVIVHCVSYLHRSEHGKLLCINWGTAYCLKQRDDFWRALCPKHWTLPRRPRKPWHSLYLTRIREEEEQVRKQADEVLNKAAAIVFKADHLQKIEKLVKAAERKFDFSVDYTSGVVQERNSLLNLAVIEKRHKIAKWLVETRGSGIETSDRGGFTPLLNAAWAGDRYMVRYLLGKGADRAKVGTGHSSQALAHPDFKGLSAEGWARKRGHEEVAELIRLGLA